MANFTKANLKAGMVVRRANGDLRIVVYRDSELVVADLIKKFERLSYYNDDLTNKDNRDNDIVEVYSIKNTTKDAFSVSTEGRELLWKKPAEIKELTLDEIESLLGYKVAIVR